MTFNHVVAGSIPARLTNRFKNLDTTPLKLKTLSRLSHLHVFSGVDMCTMRQETSGERHALHSVNHEFDIQLVVREVYEVSRCGYVTAKLTGKGTCITCTCPE